MPFSIVSVLLVVALCAAILGEQTACGICCGLALGLETAVFYFSGKIDGPG